MGMAFIQRHRIKGPFIGRGYGLNLGHRLYVVVKLYLSVSLGNHLSYRIYTWNIIFLYG